MRECFYKSKRWAIFTSIISLGLIFNNEGISSDDEKTLWSLNKISLVEPPVIKADTWSRNEIDKFILQKLRSVGIEPNPAADKLTTIRRVSFDLLGLAPTREEIQKFEADKSGNSYERLLDSLLANPHYGERWGRHWLDVARFGESHGYESDNERPHAWTYRDAVIKALNQNLPFDEFVKWQVAGDILRPEDSLAVSLTGFLSAGSTVTNVDGVDREKANYDKMDDIVSATGSAFLGLTVGCARCHNHKYDPISQEDYYKMVGFFLPGREGDRELEIGKPGSKVKAMVWNGGKKRSINS